MKPTTFAHFVSSMLYEKRCGALRRGPRSTSRVSRSRSSFGPYYCEPVIAGLEPDGTPYVTGMDLIGAMAPAEDFVVSGNNTDSLLGVCESMYKPGLEPEELFEVISQCLLAAVNRDCLSGWGGVVHVITKDGMTTRTLRGRMD
jgi:20S proteasome subunit beta 3